MKPHLVLIAIVTLSSATLRAQVPQLINYKGRVAVGSVNFDTATTGRRGQFKFALVQGAGPTLLWKNDGSAGNTEPATAVSLDVTKGLYSVLLGDTSPPLSMAAILPSVWANPDVRLRVWFSDGTSSGFQLLSPDQRLAPYGYLPDGSVTSAKLAADAVTNANIAANTLSGTQIADTLDLGSTTADGSLRLWDNGTDSQAIRLDGGSSSLGLFSGHVMPQAFLDAGASGGLFTLSRVDVTETVRIEASESVSGGAKVSLSNAAGTPTVTIEASESGSDGAEIVLRNNDGVATLVLDAEFGDGRPSRLTTGTVQITGGSDFAEQFDIRSATGAPAPQPGMIVCIDSACPGKLRPSTGAYDRTVAGIISGAGGIRPGMLMGQRDSAADGTHPVALSGRVYCHVDTALGGPIAPGDLITTSATPGHGMKVTDHERARGAIIGKAMTGLADGTGLVLVLVTLQ